MFYPSYSIEHKEQYKRHLCNQYGHHGNYVPQSLITKGYDLQLQPCFPVKDEEQNQFSYTTETKALKL